MKNDTLIISDEMRSFLEHIIQDDNDELIDIENRSTSKRIEYKLCSHATTCKFKRDKNNIDKCYHTQTCEFFCQKFVNKEHLRIKDVQFDIDLHEAREAKAQKRLRVNFEFE